MQIDIEGCLGLFELCRVCFKSNGASERARGRGHRGAGAGACEGVRGCGPRVQSWVSVRVIGRARVGATRRAQAGGWAGVRPAGAMPSPRPGGDGAWYHAVRRFKVVDRMTKEVSHDSVPWTQEAQLAALFATACGRCVARMPPMRAYFARRSRERGARYSSAHDAPRHIADFVRDYGVDASEAELPLAEYRTLNAFFARRLRAGLRPVADAADSQRLCCPVDGRYSCFESLGAARALWIKGRNFTVDELVGVAGATDAGRQIAALASHRLRRAAVCVARLAPTDYHRVHAPCVGRVARVVEIGGDYFPVKPVCVTSDIDVLTLNRRVVVQIDPPDEQMGPVFVVLVGAIEVGSIVLTAQVGDVLAKGDELGYFQYGGSTVCVVQRSQVHFEEDLLANSRNRSETLCRMGQPLAHNVPEPPQD